MTRHRYAWHALLPDYLRGLGGFGLTASGALFLHPFPAAFWLLSALALLFLGFALHTGLRQIRAIDLSDEALRRTGPFPKAIFWHELRGLDLRYYSTQREKTEGWMQLTVRGQGGRRIAVDSAIGDFPGLVARVTAEAEARSMPLNETSLANLGALGRHRDRQKAGPRHQPAGHGKKASG